MVRRRRPSPSPDPGTPTVPPRLPTALVFAALVMGPIMALLVGRAFESGELDFVTLRLLGILWLLLATIVILAWGIVQRLRGEGD